MTTEGGRPWTPAEAAKPIADPMDPAMLSARLCRTDSNARRALAIVQRQMPGRGWVAWSGGKDSTVTADLAHRVHPGVPIVHYDSGLDLPETADYLEYLPTLMGWNYQPIRVGDGLTEMVRNGSWDHDAPDQADHWWEVICAGPAREAHDRYGPVMLWGMRADESPTRRVALASSRGVRLRKDGTTTVAPIWWWTRSDTFAYLNRRGIPPNPVYARLAKMGVPEYQQRVSLAVGSDGRRSGRMTWLRRGWPDLWAQYEQALPRLREMG